jgi:hypothetical protein
MGHAKAHSPSPFPLPYQIQSLCTSRGRRLRRLDLVVNGNEIQRLAHSINAHRPDWMISSLTTFIGRHMGQWSYRDASVALTFVATDATNGRPTGFDDPEACS